MINYIMWGVLGALIVANIVLFFYFLKLKERLDIFFKSKGRNIEEILSRQIKDSKKQATDLKKIFDDIAQLDKITQKSFRKIGFVRYNPFKEAGGDQSFSIALLDSNNDGFVISSLYGRENDKVYAKPINGGSSHYSLSEEEQDVIKKAMGPK